MVNHVFASLEDAKSYIRKRLGYPGKYEMKELTDMPFLTSVMGFSASLFLNPRQNLFAPHVPCMPEHFLSWSTGTFELNAMAMFLACDLDSGITKLFDGSGDAFLIGTTAQGKTVTSNVLWGAIKCRYDASDYYATEIQDAERAGIFSSWTQDYLRGDWQPKTGNDGVDVYETDPFHCASRWRVVDHRTSTARG